MTGVAACLPGPRPGASPDWSRATALPVPLGVPPDSAAGLAEKVIKEGGMGGGGGGSYSVPAAACRLPSVTAVLCSLVNAQCATHAPIFFYVSLVLEMGPRAFRDCDVLYPKRWRPGGAQQHGWLVGAQRHPPLACVSAGRHALVVVVVGGACGGKAWGRVARGRDH